MGDSFLHHCFCFYKKLVINNQCRQFVLVTSLVADVGSKLFPRDFLSEASKNDPFSSQGPGQVASFPRAVPAWPGCHSSSQWGGVELVVK
jgi:hypothetical protein